MHIEIYSDLVCPWCYIGKRRLDAVLATELGADVNVTWRPYQLYPQLPEGGVPRQAFFRARFGHEASSAEIYRHVLEEARGEGLRLDFDAIQVAPNTFLGHCLLAWAERCADQDRLAQHRLAENLFRAYFEEGRDVGDPDVLVAAAAAAQLDAQAARAALGDAALAQDVREQLERGRELGVTGVPFFLLAGRFGIPGAQPRDVMRSILEKAQQRLREPRDGTVAR